MRPSSRSAQVMVGFIAALAAFSAVMLSALWLRRRHPMSKDNGIERLTLAAASSLSSVHAPAEPLVDSGMQMPALLLLSAAVFSLLAVVSAAHQSLTNALLWGGLALMQAGVAVRSPGFSLPKAQRYLRHPLVARRPRCWRVSIGCSGVLLALLAFNAAGDAQFDEIVLVGWIGGMLCGWIALGGHVPRRPALPRIALSRETAALAVILLLGGFALFYNLDTLPRDLISDHAEYLLDAMRVQEGARDIYFGNNSGREPLFIYLAALVSSLSSGVSYLSLKVVSASAAFLTLPLLYLLGREMDGRITGVLAAGIASVSLWTLVMGRLGFRVTLAALATALLLLTMWRALQTGSRRDFLLAGLALGLGQYGYTSFRIAPLVALLGAGLRGLNLSGRDRRELLANIAALFGIALFALVPLLSYALHYPDVFWTRTNTLAGALDLDGLLHAWIDSLLMFHLGSDPVPLNIVQPGAHVLSPLVGALFLLGMLACVRRAGQKPDPMLLFAPLAFIVLVLPSALGAGSPLETPSARRAITALPAVMLLAGSGLSLLVKGLYRFSRPLAYAVGGGALAIIAMTNLTDYAANYPANYHPPPARDIAEAIRRFEQAGGRQENIYLVYGTGGGWIDPRSIALWLGLPEMLHVLERVINCPPDDGEPLMVILAPDDDASQRHLAACFPQGQVTDVQTPEGDRFTLFFINARLTR